MDTARTAKMKSLYEITNSLLSEMVKENHIELSNYLKPKGCKTLNDVYERVLSSMCNRQGMPKNIKFEERRARVYTILKIMLYLFKGCCRPQNSIVKLQLKKNFPKEMGGKIHYKLLQKANWLKANIHFYSD